MGGRNTEQEAERPRRSREDGEEENRMRKKLEGAKVRSLRVSLACSLLSFIMGMLVPGDVARLSAQLVGALAARTPVVQK